MLGLLLKDFINLKKQILIYCFVATIFIVVGAVSGDISFSFGLTMMISAMLPMSSLYYDEQSNWDKFALTSSISRSKLALSKYVLGFILMGIFTVINIIILLIGKSLDAEMVYSLLLLLTVSLIVLSVTLPFIFKFGVEKGRTLTLAVMLVGIVIAIFSGKFLENMQNIKIEVISTIAIILAVLVLIISVIISVNIYRKKDF